MDKPEKQGTQDSVGVLFSCRHPPFGTVPESNLPGMKEDAQKKLNMGAPNGFGDEKNNVTLNDPSANYISHV